MGLHGGEILCPVVTCRRCQWCEPDAGNVADRLEALIVTIGNPWLVSRSLDFPHNSSFSYSSDPTHFPDHLVLTPDEPNSISKSAMPVRAVLLLPVGCS